MDDQPLGDRRMTGAETLMWHAERDPVLRSAFTNITLLDRLPDLERLRNRMARVIGAFPRLQQRVRTPAFPLLGPPEWVQDDAFDLAYHVRRIALPPPGNDRQLLDLAAQQAADPFDPDRPLWQFTVVEGLSGGRAALLARLHHTVTDGVGGLRLSMSFLDLDRAGASEDRLAPEELLDAAAAAASSGAAAAPEVAAGGGENPLAAMVSELRRQLAWVPGALNGAMNEAAALVTRPRDVGRDALQAMEAARSVVRQAVVVGPARSPLWADRRSTDRRFDLASFDLTALRDAAHRLGGTVNDAFVTVIAGAAGNYHRRLGVDIDELRMSMPVNVRHDHTAGGNAFVPTRLLIPVGEMPTRDRFAAVHDRLAAVKAEPALGLADTVADVVANLPPAVIARVARQQVGPVDFAASNLRGSPIDLFVAGARVTANHPMGPTGGTAFNITVLSYLSHLDVGLVSDTAAVDEPDLLKDLILSEAEVLAADAR